MQQHIAMCGLDCASCEAFIATKHNDNQLREKTAKAWTARRKAKGLNVVIKPEDISCYGCLSAGPLYSKCQRCQIRKCGLGKGITNCRQCKDYKCDRLVEFQKGLW